jgi:glycosyltransferase involved in cell wall biosynthesis
LPKAERIPVMLMARELNQGGVERDVAKIATHLDPSRFQVHVASHNARGMRYEELCAAGIPFLHLPLKTPLSRAGFEAAIRLRRYLREHAIQVLHSYDVSGVLGVPVARSLGLPAVLSSQLSYRDILDSRTQRLLRMTDRLSHAVVVNCEAIRRYMIEDQRVPARRVELCYNGVETGRFYPAESPRPEAFAGASLVIGTVCALRPEKGLLLLQEAFARMRGQACGIKLAIVGSGPELPRLKENAAHLGIEDASIFVPAEREVAPWFRAMDIFVLPSYSEAFSNSLLEAMACGCAAIGSRVGGTPELIGDDERGLLFARGDAADLAHKLAALIEDPDLRRRFGARAARFARENLTVEIAARRTAEIYEKLLRRRACSGERCDGSTAATAP